MRHLGWHGCREQHRLSLTRKFGDDPANVADESHVEHPVGLVDDEHRNRAQPDMFLLDEIEQAARRRHQDIDAPAHGFDLPALIDAAEHDGVAQPKMPPVDDQAVMDLNGEFARRSQDQGARCVRTCGQALGCQAMQERQPEGRGFAGAGLGDAQKSRPEKISGMAFAWIGVGNT